jgi:phosphatidylglycerol:prolipoprotein diacylglycerol transferase
MVAQRRRPAGGLATRTSLRRVQPEIDLGPIDLQTFGICFAAAFLGSGWLLGRRLKELGRPVDWAYEAIFAALIGGLIGSRIDYLIQNWDKVGDDIFGSIFSGSGLVWFGGLIGGAAGVLLWGWRRGFFGTTLVDACAAPLALGYAIGRIGCQLSGDGDYGVASDLPWAMAYPEGTVPTTEEVHPTPVYETLAMGLVALVLWRLRDRLAPGCLFALYLVLAGLERFLVELIRRNEAVLAGLTLAQLISLAMMAGGAAWLVAKRRQLTVSPAR